MAAARGPAAQDGLPSWAVVSPSRAAHVARVVELLAGWSGGLGLPADERARWRRAGWLHDALRDADEATLRQWAAVADGPVVLLHGPAAAARAAAGGEDDADVLEAVRWHTVGSADWAAVGRALYCADYLEPGRPFDRERRAEMAARFPEDPARILREVIGLRAARAERTGKPVLPRTQAFVRAFG